MDGVSVIICCYNSVKVLSPTLMHLAQQKVTAKVNWEIILVDNASNDDTSHFALTEWGKYNVDIPLKIISEPQAGLINARIKGTSEARYEYLVFCDDDNWLDSNYIQTALEIMSHNSQVGACGGMGSPVFETGRQPDWLSDLILTGYAIGPQTSSAEGPVTDRFYIYGAGMIVRKSILTEIYNEFLHSNFLLSGRSGKTLAAGDDGAICFFVLMKGYQLWYSSRLKFKHYLTAKRLTKEYAMKMYEGFGRASAHLKVYYLFLPAQDRFKRYILSNWLARGTAQFFNVIKFYLSIHDKKSKPFLVQMELNNLKECFEKRGELQRKKVFLSDYYKTGI